MGRSHWKEKGLSSVIGLTFLRRWKGMEAGGKMGLWRKENPLCEEDEEGTRVDTDADKSVGEIGNASALTEHLMST